MKKILVVDDTVSNRKILANILCKEYEVVEISCGEDALEYLSRGAEDVCAVLLDIIMPGMDGFEVLSRIRENDAYAGIPVIITTGYEEEDVEEKVLAMGANDFITKPYNPVLIQHCLHNVISLRDASTIVSALQRDRLTGLFSREAFFERAAAMVASHEAGYYIFAYFDVDNFKVINDQYGIAKGDSVLKHIADIFRVGFLPAGGICCRITADNFAIVYPASFADSDELAAIRDRATHPDGEIHPITFSIGRYVIEDTSMPMSAVCDRAALAQSTIKGRFDTRIVMYNEEMREKLLRQQEITSEMNAALNDRNFEVWLQPQYNHATGALIGSEALVRWRHPVKGLIPPGAFIPVFERNGFVYEVDRFVWEETCAMLRRWIDEGRSPLPISVNISRYDIFRSDLVDFITGLTDKYGISHDLLRLEITESAFSKSATQIISVVKELISRGFTIEIDDFGSGYSSLNTLKDVPADVLKLDMRFLEANDNSQRGGNILESIVRMARWLGMSVIAEGVEKIEQANFLKSIGCSYIQGYLYARPMPVDEYEKLEENAQKERRLLTLETVKNLDNHSFWNPASMDTLIFNSFVGGACILEYHNKHVELLRANDKYADVLTGKKDVLPISEALKIKWRDHLDNDSIRTALDAMAQAIESGDEITCDLIFRDLPGCDMPSYIRATLRVIASAEERYLFYCTNENTTAKTVAENNDRKNAAQLKAIMDNINGGVTATVIRDGEPHILFANDSYFEQIGYTREQFSALPDAPFELIHSDDRERVVAQTIKASEERSSFTVTYRVVRRDKSVRWIKSSISIADFPDVDGPVQLAVANDITAQREAEQREKETSERMQLIIDNVNSGITAGVMRNNDVNILFASDRYYEILGYTRAQYKAEVMNIYSLIAPQDRLAVMEKTAVTNTPGATEILEYRVRRRDGRLIWVRSMLSITGFQGIDEPVQLCIFTDITEEKTAAEALSETDELLRFLNDTAHDILSRTDSTDAINHVLKKLLDYFDGNRAYIFELDYSTSTADNTYEVCREDVTSEIENLRGVPFETINLWLRAFDNNRCICIENVEWLDDSREDERAVLRAQNITSLVAVPLRRDGKLIGFIGVDDPRQQQSKLDRLNAIGDYIAVMLTRRDLTAKIKSDNKILMGLMNDTPGGFVRMQVLEDNVTVVPLYFNDGFCKLVGMTSDELMEMYGRSSMAGVHPDDIYIVRDAVLEMLGTGEARSARYRLRHGNGGYVWVIIFGRAVKDESGTTFFNVYYTDASEIDKFSAIQREMLDNLPCAAGMYEYADGKLTIIHLNKRYSELVGRNFDSPSEIVVLDAVHPDDRQLISGCIERILKTQGSANCEARVRCGDIMASDDTIYRRFIINGRMTTHENGKHYLYVTYFPLDDEIK